MSMTKYTGSLTNMHQINQNDSTGSEFGIDLSFNFWLMEPALSIFKVVREYEDSYE